MNISSIELEVGLFAGMQKAASAIVSTREAAQWNETTAAQPLAALRRWVVLMQPADCVYIITLNRLSLFACFFNIIIWFYIPLLPYSCFNYIILRYSFSDGTMLFIYSLHLLYVQISACISGFSPLYNSKSERKYVNSRRGLVLVGAEAGERMCASNSFLRAFKMRNLSLR